MNRIAVVEDDADSRPLRQAILEDSYAVALTAFAMAGDRERCLAAGFSGYLAKPIVDEQVLLRAIEEGLAT